MTIRPLPTSAISPAAQKVGTEPSPSTVEALRDVCCAVCDQLADAIDRLSDDQYTSTAKHNAPIGKHVRHILEFYRAFFKKLAASEVAYLSYDKRERDTSLETSRVAALTELKVIQAQLAGLPEANRSITLQSIIDPCLPMFTLETSLHRELFYLVDHTIHHMALIKNVAIEKGLPLGHSFGLAQSTKAYEGDVSCQDTIDTESKRP